MKRIILSLLAVLLAGSLLPVLCYYGFSALMQKDAHTAAQDFWSTFQSDSNFSFPEFPHSTSSPVPEATPQTDEDLVPIWDSGAQRVIQVPLREYVIGAVASEMPITWSDAALQAQAVAAHTYLLYSRDHNDTSALGGAWLSADPAQRQGFMTDEVLHSYWGTHYNENYSRLSALVDQVLNTIITYEDKPAAASYFAISNGRTEASQNVWTESLPYLQGVDSSWDKEVEGYAQTITLSSTQMHSALVTGLNIRPDGFMPSQYFSNFTYTDAGYIQMLQVCGQETLGTVLRSALNLRSNCFTIEWDGNNFQITTYGYGHGVGLSQTGAQEMGKNGNSWQEILQHYFPGTSLSNI